MKRFFVIFLFVLVCAAAYGIIFTEHAFAKSVYLCQALASGESNVAYTNPQTCDASCSISACITHTVSDSTQSVYVCDSNRSIIAEDAGACALLCSGSVTNQSSCTRANISTASPPPSLPEGQQPGDGGTGGSAPQPGGAPPAPVTTDGGGFAPFVQCALGDADPTQCNLCEAFRTGWRVVQFLFYAIMLPLVAIAFIIGGIILLTAAGNETRITRGKSIVSNTFIGFIIAFAAWLIISTVIVNLALGVGDIQYSDTGTTIKWYQFPDCTSGTEVPLDLSSSGGGGSTSNPPDNDNGNGQQPPPGGSTCSPVSQGVCSVNSLQNTCFGNNAQNASIICQAESAGVAAKPSGSDVCEGDGSVVSWGLFQINISANTIGGLDCPSAFDSAYTGSNHNCRVVNRDLYNQCVAAAQNASSNINKACEISRGGTSFNRSDAWQNTATACNIP
ncbi:MAG: hypothetical protein COU47_02285 [Candidatus Niyogibacteria bacterium CG10_big_fil_rev_8_21_14_0_10_46_36]|uniref:Transglycosylase SLT domain-containing protein n=1 Tax=Candidatus Niyogibacteria bacterium CG10_big_fil_rev_8_21_14_0_10_46_36 TaxID=1974726 RepID=A0A2H0TDC2_9BACT|nr:MAG: hypothetical protein COU47_02285 [Candidatus Niyogibacteria bacterium CG10_big_fil_rev_8_21_14_0_10_46_36]